MRETNTIRTFPFLGEAPGLSNLLQSAFLLAQQLERGSNPCNAFLNTITDVYYKSRSPNGFNVDAFESVLEIKVKELLSEKHKDIYNNRTTININCLQSHSEIEKIKQQTSLLMPKTVDLSASYMLMQIYSITSREDFKTRQLFLQKNMDNIKHVLAKTECFDLPQDSRWLPDAIYKDRNLNNSNKTLLNMFLALKPNFGESSGFLIEYMKNVRLRKVEAKIDDTIVAKALDLFEKYDDFLQNVTNSSATEINDQQLIETLSLMRWRNVFYKSTFVGIPKANSLQFQEMLANLHIHYKWFSKYAIHKLQQLLDVPINKPLQELVSQTDDVLINEFSTLKKIAKNYQKLTHSPPPLINNTQLLIIPAFYEITEKVNIYNKHNDFDAVIGVLQKTKALRSDLISLSVQLDFAFCELPEAFENLRKSIGDSNAQQAPVKVHETRLLPLQDYFVRLQLLKTRNDLNVDANFLIPTATIPCGLAGSLLRYKRTGDVRLMHEMNVEFYYYLMSCAAQCPGKFLNFKNTDREDVVLSFFSPTLSYIVTELLIPNERRHLELFTCLGNYLDVKKQLRIMNTALWGNIRQICLPENDYL